MTTGQYRRMQRRCIRDIVCEFPSGYQFTSAEVSGELKKRHNLELPNRIIGKYLSGMEEVHIKRVKTIHAADTDYCIWRRL